MALSPAVSVVGSGFTGPVFPRIAAGFPTNTPADPSAYVRVGGPVLFPLPPTTAAPFPVNAPADPSQYRRVGGPVLIGSPESGAQVPPAAVGSGGKPPASFRPIGTFFGASETPTGKGEPPPLLAAGGFGGATAFEPATFAETPRGGAPMAYPDPGPASAEVPGWLILAAVAVAAFVVLK